VDLTLEMIEKQGILDELAKCFENKASAEYLLSEVRIELSSFPPFGTPNIKKWWRQVCKEIESGLSEKKNLDELIKAALKEYKGNKLFKRLVVKDKQSIFLSYSSENRPDVDPLFEALNKYPDVETFQDHRSISIGKDWLEVIKTSASRSSLMVCWLTNQYLASGFCHYEIGMAESADAKIISILVDDSISKLPSYLERLQGIKLKKPINYNALAKQLMDLLMILTGA
jgi:hypothetical protein